MKKIAAVMMLALAVTVAVAAVPTVAEARNGRWAGHRFWPGFAVGTATGLVFGTVLAPRYSYPPAVYYAPPPVYYGPSPVYVAPAPVCYTTHTSGYWATVPVNDGYGYTTYQYQYVPGRPQTVCR